MSTQITTELVKELRNSTGISVMQCRKALEEADGDMEKAIAILKKTSANIALKKADREAVDGSVTVKSSGNKTILLPLHCETDFVSKNEDFVNLMNKLVDMALENGAENTKNSSSDMIAEVIQKTGEKIELGEIYEITGETVGSYVHNNKKAVVVSLTGGNSELAKDIAMHIAAMNPEFITKEEIDETTKNTMTELFQKEVAGLDKPEEIKTKMLEGKINTYFKEKTLMDQEFIKDSNETIASLLSKNGAEIKEVKRYSI